MHRITYNHLAAERRQFEQRDERDYTFINFLNKLTNSIFKSHRFYILLDNCHHSFDDMFRLKRWQASILNIYLTQRRVIDAHTPIFLFLLKWFPLSSVFSHTYTEKGPSILDNMTHQLRNSMRTYNVKREWFLLPSSKKLHI